jgi:2-polyprenyl-6-hydroxyphenyl methylase/3-demethylubiquinone-9 3-methyltransferase
VSHKIAPCIWYNGTAEEAATFYAATFPDSRVDGVNRAPADYPNGKAGDAITVSFTVCGMNFTGLNGGPMYTPNEAISFTVYTEDQAETDRLWNAIVAGGGAESMCGWCKDKWGVSWQITPRALIAAMSNPDSAAAKRGMEAMMTMRKIDIAAIERAVAGA